MTIYVLGVSGLWEEDRMATKSTRITEVMKLNFVNPVLSVLNFRMGLNDYLFYYLKLYPAYMQSCVLRGELNR